MIVQKLNDDTLVLGPYDDWQYYLFSISKSILDVITNVEGVRGV